MINVKISYIMSRCQSSLVSSSYFFVNGLWHSSCEPAQRQYVILATLEDMLKTGQTFFAALYGQSKSASLNVVRYTIYTKKKGKPPLVKALPPTDKNLLLHMLRAHNQTMLWKAADKQVAPAIVITDFGWEMLNSIPSPVFASGLPAPPELMKVISCQCRAAGKACALGIRMYCFSSRVLVACCGYF